MFTLGARDFSCAVSGFGQVFISDPREKQLSCAREKPLVPRVHHVRTAAQNFPSGTWRQLKNRFVPTREMVI